MSQPKRKRYVMYVNNAIVTDATSDKEAKNLGKIEILKMIESGELDLQIEEEEDI